MIDIPMIKLFHGHDPEAWKTHSSHEPPKHIDIPLPYLPRGGVIAPLAVQRYIRADLAQSQGDPEHKIQEGQWRWTKLYDNEEWTPRQVSVWYDLFCFSYSQEDGLHAASEMSSIGPVIRPPAEISND